MQLENSQPEASDVVDKASLIEWKEKRDYYKSKFQRTSIRTINNQPLKQIRNKTVEYHLQNTKTAEEARSNEEAKA